MTTANTQVIARVAAAVAGLGLVAMSFAPLANAQTTTTTTTTTSAAASLTFIRDLTIGSTGSDVTSLQTWLIAKGFSIPAGATGYFGAQTKAALGAYQASVAITPAVGYFGPITRAYVNVHASDGVTTGTLPAGCTSATGYSTTTGMSCAVSTTLPAGCTSTVGYSPTTGMSCSGGTTTTTGPLSGGEGSIDNFKTVGATNTSLNAADSQQVLGFEFKASGSDLSVNRVDFDLVNNAGTGTVRPWGVFQTATLMDGSTVIGTVDISNQANWSQDGTNTYGNQVYRVRFDGLNDVVRNGNTVDFYLKLDTQNTISSSNAGGTYTVSLPNQGLRAVDAKGIQQYTSSQVTGQVSVSAATTGSVVLSTGSDNPQTSTVQGDSNVSTTGITLNSFTVQAKNSDLMLYSIPVRVTSSSSPSSNIVRTLKLYQGSTLLDTESIAASTTAGTATTTFQNLNFKISQGSTVAFKIVAEINRIDGSSFQEGANITVTVPGTGIDIENGSNTVSVTGSSVGNTISFRSIGLAIDPTPTSATATATAVGTTGTQQGNFTYVFNVTGFGQDIFFSKNGNATIFGKLYSNGSSTAASTTVASTTAITSTADTSANGTNYVIHSGQTKQVSVTVTVPQGTNAPLNSVLTSFQFGLTDAAPSATSTPFNNNYQTPSVFLHA
ncbi:hypothetical protein BH11PAT2_BH11PAT2_07520 [soil metagenome]